MLCLLIDYCNNSFFCFFIGDEKEDISDMLAVDLDNGQLRISVSQGEQKVFQKTLRSSKSSLADGAFHHVMIYKREKVIHNVSQGVIDHIFRILFFGIK